VEVSGPPLVKAGQSGSGRKCITFQLTCTPEKLLTAVVVGSSSPVPVTNHQQVIDHVVFPIVKKLKGTQTHSVSNQSQIWKEVKDPGCYYEPGNDSHLLDIAMELGMETGLQKTVLDTPPLVSGGAVPVLGEQAAKPGENGGHKTCWAGTSCEYAQPRQLNGPRGACGLRTSRTKPRPPENTIYV
jgi:hypothetical protein